MKKVLKLSSLLAAVLLLAALAGVQLLFASSHVRTDVDIDSSYVSNNPAGGVDNTFMVVVADDAGWATGNTATTSVGVRNEDTKDEIKLVVTASTTAADTAAIAAGETCGTCLWTAEVSVVVTSTGATAPFIVASDGDVIQASYQSADSVATYSDSVTVDAKGPVFSNVSPGHGTRTKTGTIIFTVDISDAGVGVGDIDRVEDETVFTLVGVDTFNGVASDEDDGNWRVSKIVSLTERDFEWYITLTDTLGNATQSDAIPDDDDENTTEDDGDNRYTLVIDLTKPTIASATTGMTLDTSDDPAVRKASNSRTSIAVEFDEDLNGGTVDDTDFLVVVDSQNQDIAAVDWHEDLPEYVFITLETELSGDDTPVVRVVRGIEDVAGNEQSSFEPDDPATDGIAPSLTVSIVGTADDNPVTNGTIKVRVSADEDSINPNAKTGAVATLITGEGEAADLDDTAEGADFRTITPNKTWEWTFEFDDDGREDGLYNVCVQIDDISDGANTGSAGLCTATVDTGSDDILAFEVDTRHRSG